MPDVADLEQQINMLKFQLQVANPASAQGQQIKQQIEQLQQQLAFEKVRQGSPS